MLDDTWSLSALHLCEAFQHSLLTARVLLSDYWKGVQFLIYYNCFDSKAEDQKQSALYKQVTPWHNEEGVESIRKLLDNVKEAADR